MYDGFMGRESIDRYEPEPWRFWCAATLPALATIGAVFGVPLLIATEGSVKYSAFLFLGVPLIQGVLVGSILQARHAVPRRTYWAAINASGFVSALLLLIGLREGFICIILALPLLLPMLYLGGQIAMWLSKSSGTASISLLVLPVAVLAGTRLTYAPKSTNYAVTETIINAPAEEIYPLAKSLDRIEPSEFWLFRMGVAHPVSTQTFADGTRICRLSTGDMPEVVTRDAPNRELRFKVLATPPTMREANPFGNVHADHLSDNFRVHHGGFEFVELPGGRTLVRGQTEYSHRLGPAWYWDMWTDAVVHEVHGAVFSEMRRRAEPR